MEFYHWLDLNESNFRDLYISTVDAFPRTRKRQHAIDEISISNLYFLPYQGVRTLFVKGVATNLDKGTEYKPMILFKNVKYHESRSRNYTEIVASNNGRNYFFERLNDQNDILVRCNCMDFKYRFKYEDHLKRCLYGHKGAPYIGQGLWEANPYHLPGMCKHIIKLARILEHIYE